MSSFVFWGAVTWCFFSLASLTALLFPGTELTPLEETMARVVLLSDGLMASVWIILYVGLRR